MRRLLWTAVVLGGCLGGGAVAIMDAGGSDPSDEQVAELIRKLGDESYEVREAASKRLLEEGEAVLPALLAAAAADDVEVRLRARRLCALLLLESRSTKMSLVFLPRGEFNMGSPPGEFEHQPDEYQHVVTIGHDFLLGEREVTQSEYQAVMRVNPSEFTSPIEDSARGVPRVPAALQRLPVESISWFDALEFCNRLSQSDGYAPYYELTDVVKTKNSITKAAVEVRGGNGYRLPTEAEWEYACRARTLTPFNFGDRNSGREANVKPAVVAGGYGGPAPQFRHIGRTTSVASYPANAWGLYDMHGNVAEWCWDWYDKDYYRKSPAADPQGPDVGVHRTVRGGSWMSLEGTCRSSSRFWLAPNERKDHVGFRVARTPNLRMSK